MDLQNILIIIAAVVNSILGFFVYSRNPRNKVNQWFTIFVVTLVFWCVAMFLYRLSPTKEGSFFWVIILYEAAILIPPTFMYFSFTLPDGNITVNKYIRIFLWLPVLALGILTAMKGNVVTNIQIIPGQEKGISWGPYYLTYNIYFVLYFSILFFVLFKKLLASSEITRTQIKFILIGTFIPSMLANSSNLLLPTFHNFTFNWLGQVMTIPMVVSIFYAIIKHHLMNVKVITTEIFSILVSLVLLVNTLLSKSLNDFILNISLFLAISFFSVMLIRGVLKEVKSREVLTELTEELQKANEDLKKLDQAKSEFISIASHQLRTPLSIIKGFVSMLMEGSYGNISEKQEDILKKIYASNERLINLINDLLDLSRMEGGRMQFEWTFLQISEIVESVIEELKPEAQAKNLELRWINRAPEKMYVRADQAKLRQVIMNLVDNAIKYTKEGFIEVRLTKTKEGFARFSVRDTGIGIEPDEMQILFGKFVRGKNVPQLWTEGAGLGLYVAKKILEEHKGRIWGESAGKGEGSTFFLELPVY